MTSNEQITTELVDHHGAFGLWAAVPNADLGTAVKEPVVTIRGGNAGSVEVSKQIKKETGCRRRGRTHRKDVDRLLETTKIELDIYLHRIKS